MKRTLTHRQQQFLSDFLDLYREAEGPVHYSQVAQRLDVGNVTAYEMLRLLEERGLVRAEYQPNPVQSGPGRSQVLFSPTQEGRQVIERLAGDPGDLEDWQAARERILQEIRDGKAGGYETLLSDLFARLPGRRSPLIFITEFITAVILTLTTISEAPEMGLLMGRLRRLGLPEEIGLNALSGISLALSTLERINRHFSSAMLAQLGRYDSMLAQLSEENRRRLSDFAREVSRMLTG